VNRILLLLLAAALACAEACAAPVPAGRAASGSVGIASRVFPEKATVGDELRLYLRADRPKDWTLRPPSAETKLGPFEVKSVEKAPVERGKNRVGEVFVLTLTTFELGRLTVPPVSVTFIDERGREGQVFSDPVAVEIVSVSKAPPAGQAQLKPIKGPVSLSLDELRTLVLAVLAALLSAILALKLFFRLRSRIVVDPETLKPAHERALLELGRLRQAGLLPQGRLKEHYSALSDVLRRYITRRFGVDAADLTTAELLAALKESAMSREALAVAREVLEASDLVKFAKYEPSRPETGQVEARLEEFVASTKPAPEPEAAKK